MPDEPRAAVALVGDVMFQRPLDSFPAVRGARFQATLARLRASAVRVGNLEMPLSRRGSCRPKYSNPRADPNHAGEIRALGFHGATLANNHMRDYGADGLFDTFEACDAAGMLRCDAGRTLEEALAPSRFEVDGRRIAVLNVATTLPPGAEATETGLGIAPIGVAVSFEVDLNPQSEQPGTVPIVHTAARPAAHDRIGERVRLLARAADCVVVVIHWGVPGFWLSPSPCVLAEYQKPLGRTLIDAGADLIFGHHAQALHGTEAYNGKAICCSVGTSSSRRRGPSWSRRRCWWRCG